VAIGVGCEESSLVRESLDSLVAGKAGLTRSGEVVNGIKLDLRFETCVKSSVVSTSKVRAAGLFGVVGSDQGFQSEENLNAVNPGREVPS
jgi:hypothetical protein